MEQFSHATDSFFGCVVGLAPIAVEKKSSKPSFVSDWMPDKDGPRKGIKAPADVAAAAEASAVSWSF